MPKVRKTTDAVEILHRRYVRADAAMTEYVEQARMNARIARQIHALRLEAHLTQRQLAQRVGTTPSVISRLEDDDYEGHSLNMLMRIAAALGKQIRVEFAPVEGRKAS